MKKQPQPITIERTPEDGIYIAQTAHGPLKAIFGDGYVRIGTYYIDGTESPVSINNVDYRIDSEMWLLPYMPPTPNYDASFGHMSEPQDGTVWTLARKNMNAPHEVRPYYTLEMRRPYDYSSYPSDSARTKGKALVRTVLEAVLSAYPLAPMHGTVRSLRNDAENRNRDVQNAVKNLDVLLAQHAEIKRQLLDAETALQGAES